MLFNIAQATRVLELVGFLGLVAKTIHDALRTTKSTGVELSKEEIAVVRLALADCLQRLKDHPNNSSDKKLCEELLDKLWNKYHTFD